MPARPPAPSLASSERRRRDAQGFQRDRRTSRTTGPSIDRHADVGDNTIKFVTFNVDMDGTPAAEGSSGRPVHVPALGLRVQGEGDVPVRRPRGDFGRARRSTSHPATCRSSRPAPSTCSSARRRSCTQVSETLVRNARELQMICELDAAARGGRRRRSARRGARRAVRRSGAGGSRRARRGARARGRRRGPRAARPGRRPGRCSRRTSGRGSLRPARGTAAERGIGCEVGCEPLHHAPHERRAEDLHSGV